MPFKIRVWGTTTLPIGFLLAKSDPSRYAAFYVRDDLLTGIGAT